MLLAAFGVVPRTVEQAAREPVRLALLDANGPTGTFSNEDGPAPVVM